MFDIHGSIDLVDPRLNILIIISYIWDILLSFHTSYYNKGIIISNKKSIAINYVRTALASDLLALLPLIVFH